MVIRKSMWCSSYLVWLLFWDSIPTSFIIVFPVNCFCYFSGERRVGQLCRWYHLMWFCEVHRKEVEANLPDVTASCYNR